MKMNICVKSSIPIDLNSPSICKLGSNTLIHLYDVVNYPNLTKYVFFLEKIQYKNKKCLIYSTCTTKFEMKHSTYHTTGTERRAGHMIQTKISSQ